MPRGRDAGKRTSVYLIEAGPFVKIGVAVDVRKRLSSLRAGMPEDVGRVMLREFEFNVQAFAVERRLHRHFRAKRAKGEWFRISLEHAVEALEAADTPRWDDLVHGRWKSTPRAEAKAEIAAAMRAGREKAEAERTSGSRSVPL